MNNKSNDRVFGYIFANVYPLYIEILTLHFKNFIEPIER